MTTTPTPEVQRAAKTLTTAVTRLESARTDNAITKATAARDAAMIAMREAGASYAQIAGVLGVVPMTARNRVLKITG